MKSPIPMGPPDVNELRDAYEGFHADVRAVLDACPDCHKWAILEREPLARWSAGRVALLLLRSASWNVHMSRRATDARDAPSAALTIN